ncbi:MAG: hypothetical protein LBG46_03155 [Elusimicrobiota bacterium]|jgi:hypothetical protein|nr:hypothetical protein [Elusimicrobiota bacterium]
MSASKSFTRTNTSYPQKLYERAGKYVKDTGVNRNSLQCLSLDEFLKQRGY